MVIEVVPGSIADQAGVREGDRILSVNDHPIHDELDLMFYSNEPAVVIKVKRNGRTVRFMIEKDEDEDTGVTLNPITIDRCKNSCIFCFVNQLPGGLRESLYVKDEDYRFSFLYGNYVTLSNITDHDRQRIFAQRLSPLYISVHTTNHELRKIMLGNQKAGNIMSELGRFRSEKIRFHTQIVLCPGYNDGEELERTISDLARFYPYIMSIAVVPVGLTSHRKKQLRPVTKIDAEKALAIVGKFRRRFVKKHGDPLVYGSDELYIKADRPFPPLKEYGDLPQIENGVGMVPEFLEKSGNITIEEYTFAKKKFFTFSGTSFFPFLTDFVERMKLKTGLDIDIFSVANDFFGAGITVSGLLTGKDIITTSLRHVSRNGALLIPDVVLKNDEDILLDDITVDGIQNALDMEVRVIDSTPEGLIRGMEETYEYRR